MPNIDILSAIADKLRANTAFLRSVGINTAAQAEAQIKAYYTVDLSSYKGTNDLLMILTELYEEYPVLTQAGVECFGVFRLTIECLTTNTQYLNGLTLRLAALIQDMQVGNYRLGNHSAPISTREYLPNKSTFSQTITLSFSVD